MVPLVLPPWQIERARSLKPGRELDPWRCDQCGLRYADCDDGPEEPATQDPYTCDNCGGGMDRVPEREPGEQMQVWVPVEPQDLNWWRALAGAENEPRAVLFAGMARLCRYGQPGDLLRYFCPSCEGVGEYMGQSCPRCKETGELTSNLRLTDVRVKTLGEMTVSDARACGHGDLPESERLVSGALIERDIRVRWNAQHREHRWSEGRVCWVLEMEAT